MGQLIETLMAYLWYWTGMAILTRYSIHISSQPNYVQFFLWVTYRVYHKYMFSRCVGVNLNWFFFNGIGAWNINGILDLYDYTTIKIPKLKSTQFKWQNKCFNIMIKKKDDHNIQCLDSLPLCLINLINACNHR